MVTLLPKNLFLGAMHCICEGQGVGEYVVLFWFFRIFPKQLQMIFAPS